MHYVIVSVLPAIATFFFGFVIACVLAAAKTNNNDEYTPREALELARDRKLAFRPVSWRGKGCAFAFNKTGNIILMGKMDIQYPGTSSFISVKEASDIWEVVDPLVVSNENN